MTLTTVLSQLAKQQVKLWAEDEQLRVQAPKGAMTPDLRELITANKAELLTWLQTHKGSVEQKLLPIVPEPHARYQPFPLTDMQYAYWLGQTVQMDLQNGYHVYQEIDVADLDIPRAQQTWQRLVNHHEMLRAVILPAGQQQVLSEVPDYTIALVDLTSYTEEKRQDILMQIRTEMSHQKLDLAQWPLFDIRITRITPIHSRVHVSMALISLDGSSFYQLLRTWNTLYHHPTTPLPSLELSYRDYVLWTIAQEKTEQYQQARAYWLNRLDTLPLAPKLPAPRRVVKSENNSFFVHRVLYLDARQWSQLKRHAQQLTITPTVLLAAIFAEVMTTWSEQPRFTLNCTFFNRPAVIHEQINEILGDFTSLTLLEIDHSKPASLVERAKQIHHQLWQDLEHQTFNGMRVIQEMIRRHKNQSGPLLPIVFTSMLGVSLEKTQEQSKSLLGGERGFSISQTPQVLLDVQISDDGDGIAIVWDAVESYFPDGLIQVMFDTFGQLILDLTAEEGLQQQRRTPLLPPLQVDLYAQINDTTGTFADEPLDKLFCTQVEKRGNAPAVITPQYTLSYQALYERATAVAHWLQQQNGGKPLAADTLVAIVMEKGWEQVVGVFGILMAGAAYVPIDPTLPQARRDDLLEQSDVTLVLTQSKIAAALSWPQQIPANQRLCVDLQAVSATLPAVENHNKPSDLAYVLYTSGSTGVPKGVMIEHRSVVNRMSDIAERFGLTADDRAIALTALHHDLSVFDILGMLAIVGGAIVLPAADKTRDPEHWAELMVRQQVTLWNSVPAFLQMFVEHLEHTHPAPMRPADLRWVILAGDFIPVSLPDRLRSLQPTVQVIASGGPTETTVWDIYYPVGEVEPTWPSIPYGQPLKNAHYYVMDEHLQLRPTWVPGELCIGGVGLARGYWKDEEKTRAKFVIHPQTGERLYRSGDLGRLLPDGNIEILGRTDFQVKIRGQRIELGEIETYLRQHALIKEAVVNTVDDAEGQRQLVAYVVLADGVQESEKASHATADAQVQEAVAITHLPGATVLDPIERMTFKLNKHGIRHFDATESNGTHPNGATSKTVNTSKTVKLPKPEIDEAFQSAFLARQSYRRFCNEPIPLAELSQFLVCLLSLQLPKTPFPKYRYASAGGLYPIQTYLYVKEGRVAGLENGFYYHDPIHHHLVWLGSDRSAEQQLYPGTNQAIFDQGAFAIFLIADMAAIAPMYGELARDFCLLEAGYISQLLMMEAPTHLLGLCPIGGVNGAMLQHTLALGKNHQILHSLIGGRITPQQHTEWLQDSNPNGAVANRSAAWQLVLQQALQEKLPAHMVPTAYVALDALPLTANGKLDRTALPTPVLSTSVEVFVAPTSKLEKAISDVVQEMIDITEISIDHNFADLGLNSVQMVRFNNRLKETLNRQIPIAALFQNTTVRTLAHYLEHSEQQRVVQQEEKAIAKTRSEQRVQVRLAAQQRQRR